MSEEQRPSFFKASASKLFVFYAVAIYHVVVIVVAVITYYVMK